MDRQNNTQYPTHRQTHHETGRGVALAVGASAVFALLSAYTKWLAPLDGLDIFAWRVLWTLPGAVGLVMLRRRGPQAMALLRRLPREKRLAGAYVLLAALLGVQLWIFLWAPLHGHALEVSLGYFLMPLVMVLVGRGYYREPLDVWQWLAVACAALGVGHELWTSRAFAWPTLVVALGYPPYFVVRRRLDADPVVSFAVEIALMTPVALALLFARDSLALVAHRPQMALLLPGLGVLSTVGLGCYLSASRLLPMALFGLLGYVEPILLVGVAIALLGETLAPGQLGTYVPIWCAVVMAAIHTVAASRRPTLTSHGGKL